MSVWAPAIQPSAAEAAPALVAHAAREHQQELVVRSAFYSTLVGQYRHHYGDSELPTELATRDRQAHDEAADLLDFAQAAGTPAPFDLAAANAHAYRLGLDHAHPGCPFCLTADITQALTAAFALAL